MFARKKVILFIVFSFVFSSCLGPENNPEAVLRDFIQKQFDGKLTRKDVLKRTTGELFKEYSKMTDETFKNLFLKKRLVKKKVKINFKKCSDLRCSITFSIAYDAYENKEIKNMVETKKIASLLKDNKDVWKIEKIVNLKTYFENSPIKVR